MSESIFTVIGGEFECDFTLLEGEKEIWYRDGSFYSSGRAALFHIFLYVREKFKKTTVYLPDYLCESIIEVATLAKLTIRFYPTSDFLLPKIDFFKKCKLDYAVVVLINYYGGINLKNTISELKALNDSVCLIEDNVQAYFVMQENSQADFSFTSFRKQFPVPDGGWVKSKYKGLPECTNKNTFASYKIAGGVMKFLRRYGDIEDEFYLSLFQKGEKLINNNLGACMSEFTYHVLTKMNMSEIANKRKANADYLIKKLKELNIVQFLAFEENMTPLFVPIYLENRDMVRKCLSQENIFCPVHWPCTNLELKRGIDMAKHELSLVIDQRYDLGDMKRIVQVLKTCHENRNC